ncbi:alpha/beta hydrolase [Kutzneria viridogrisea]|uniref:Alpha/beta hydrolase domain-containing protein n=2 Tax=Kutzneria TaxID=43356 RepID=W5W7L2_9PSEU|nr:alpha/beta hydrolase [Kutzneria albida]AHH94199.1 alpha/beta hydrolase domain-containing protein [Kutzneria albida DSM 43870]MBA8929872.1 acetyl esterase/lipase [Kutzneria viridogrisea]
MPSPEFEALLAAITASPRPEPAAGAEGLRAARAAMDLALGAIPLAEGVVVGETNAQGTPSVWVRPTGAAMDRVVLYFHGGGFRAGSAAAFSGFASQIAVTLGVPLLVLDYRLAPEHPFPAAVEDCRLAYEWVLDEGYAPHRVAFLGDTSGGGLALSTLLAARDAGVPQPAAAACLSPILDLTASADSYRRFAEHDPIGGRAQVLSSAADYLNGTDPRDPLASPLYSDLSGLAPVLVQAGDREVLVDDAAELVDRITKAGGRAVLDLWPDLIQFWHLFAPDVPESTAALLAVADFLYTHLS